MQTEIWRRHTYRSVEEAEAALRAEAPIMVGGHAKLYRRLMKPFKGEYFFTRTDDPYPLFPFGFEEDQSEPVARYIHDANATFGGDGWIRNGTF